MLVHAHRSRQAALRAAPPLVGAAITVALLSGCSSQAPRTTEQAFSAAGAGTTISTTTTTAGTVLADGQGRVLYTRVPAGGPCSGGCEAQWPAYRADGVPYPADGALNPLRADQIGTAPAADGGSQVRYAGHTLHRFAGDTKPGAVTGQGLEAFGATWYPLNPNGDPVLGAGSRR